MNAMARRMRRMMRRGRLVRVPRAGEAAPLLPSGVDRKQK
jgi:hypothetical protein